ncbi:YncE family protein, partial [Mesorhizobium sp. M1C.F.Ca.ET.189.01.1.1]|uniref:YncE family protein n=1 Tax=Mesorhizobium sp. M1C.F.Ca.ET.189.01.1.1 TaxID=2563925 RepID=UPI001092723D
GHLSPVTTGALPRVYVPNRSSNSVSVIDSVTLKEVDRFNVGSKPQHVVPSWDLKTLWVANNGTGKNGSLTPIDPMTAKPGEQVPVDDPYNLYFMPDGSAAIVVDEAMQQLDFRDPHSMALKSSLPTPTCPGINHADFSVDGSYAIFTCEYGDGGLAKIDLKNQKVL